MPDEPEKARALDKEVLVDMPSERADAAVNDGLLETLLKIHQTIVEIANTQTSGWPENTPAEKYKIIMTHMADQAREAAAAMAVIVRFLKA